MNEAVERYTRQALQVTEIANNFDHKIANDRKWDEHELPLPIYKTVHSNYDIKDKVLQQGLHPTNNSDKVTKFSNSVVIDPKSRCVPLGSAQKLCQHIIKSTCAPR